MPWCPKCKNEYKEGYTVCADCGAELVEILQEDFVTVSVGPEEELHKICDFMHANGIDETKVILDEEENTYKLLVEPKKAVEAGKQIQVYVSKIAAPQMLAKEAKRIEEEGITLPEPETYNGPYQEAGQRAEEYKSGADTLLIIGILGIIALVLLNLGIIPISLTFFSKMLVTFVMGVLFVIFLVMGVASGRSYHNLKEQAGAEKDLKAELQNFLREQVKQDIFDEDLTDDEPSEEILYFRRIEKMKELLNEKDASLDSAFADYIIEETYSEIFE